MSFYDNDDDDLSVVPSENVILSCHTQGTRNKRSSPKKKKSSPKNKRSSPKKKRSSPKKKKSSPKKKRSSPKKNRSSPKKKKSSPKKKRSSAQKEKSSEKGCSAQHTEKYMNRNSPRYPANKCCHSIKLGNDGHSYQSIPNKNGVCAWKKL